MTCLVVQVAVIMSKGHLELATQIFREGHESFAAQARSVGLQARIRMTITTIMMAWIVAKVGSRRQFATRRVVGSFSCCHPDRKSSFASHLDRQRNGPCRISPRQDCPCHSQL